MIPGRYYMNVHKFISVKLLSIFMPDDLFRP